MFIKLSLEYLQIKSSELAYPRIQRAEVLSISSCGPLRTHVLGDDPVGFEFESRTAEEYARGQA
jgi:hypothetical protein